MANACPPLGRTQHVDAFFSLENPHVNVSHFLITGTVAQSNCTCEDEDYKCLQAQKRMGSNTCTDYARGDYQVTLTFTTFLLYVSVTRFYEN